MEPEYFIRNFQAGDLMEKFLISAVSSILIIRVFLALTNYPIIGSGEFHIAHMLLGGMLMAISLLLLLIFLNNNIKTLCSILGGIGFGTFIDELGKFITKDNDYFFQPTIALIYVIFVVLYLWYRIVYSQKNKSKKEYAVNAVELVKEIVLNDFDTEEKKNAQYFLKNSDYNNFFIDKLSNLVSQMESIPVNKGNIITKIKNKIKSAYSKIIRIKLFGFFMILFFTIISSFQLFSAFSLISKNASFSNYGFLISSLISLLLVFISLYSLLLKHRLTAYKILKISVLISIFLTQFFLFLQEQLNAVSQILLNLLIISILQNFIYQEEMIQAKKEIKDLK